MKEKRGIASKVKRYLRARAEGKRFYERADMILVELLEKMKVGEELVLDGTGRKAKLVDNFAEDNTVYRAHGIKRFEIKVTEP